MTIFINELDFRNPQFEPFHLTLVAKFVFYFAQVFSISHVKNKM